MKIRYIVPFFLCLLFGCSEPERAKTETVNFEKIETNYARGLRLWKKESLFKVEIRNPRDTSELIATYFIGPEIDTTRGNRIAVPVQSVALNSTTFIAFFDRLGLAELVKGVTYADRVMNPVVKAQIDANETIELASANKVDFEKVLVLNPDIFMAYTHSGSDFSRIEDQGIPVVLNMEYLETHPLGRAEWIKLVGILTGKMPEATRIYEAIEKRYLDLKKRVAQVADSPMVFTGSHYNGIWYVPGRDSYIAHCIRDAGGRYVFENLEGAGSHEVDYETALKAVSKVDYWGLVISQKEPFSLDAIREIDPYYTTLDFFKKGNVFVCNAAKIDYFGDAVVEPEIVLSDMVALFHPDILPDYSAKYFHSVE